MAAAGNTRSWKGPAGFHGTGSARTNRRSLRKRDTFYMASIGATGPGRIRTVDLFHAMEARSQLRHRPM